jgi:ATP-dependent Clp protease adaptor protein ClpS
MATRKGPQQDDGGVGTVPEEKTKQRLQKPKLFKVIFHNDNYTTQEFVIAVLRSIFHKQESDAVAIMLNVHINGMGVAGVYTWEVAETKVNETHARAREYEFPLKLTIEPEEL